MKVWERKCYHLVVECQLTHVEELGKSPLATIIIKIDSSKNYQQILGERERLKNSLKISLHKLLINDQGETDFTVENPSRIMVVMGL